VREVRYRSGDLDLRAWLRVPPSGPAKAPAVVYFHGGYAYGNDDMKDALPLGAGRVLLCPTVRGENGNAGSYEMFFSEVDDARAAVRWLAEQPFVDPARIYTFGHSAGGILSALLSLYDDVPVKHGGSAGGLYDGRLFEDPETVPFDTRDPEEARMRVLVGNIRWMRRRHYGYCGAGDKLQAVEEARREAGASSLLTVNVLPGDHFTSLAQAVEEYGRVLAREG
jgi:acetyl esterase/lipase